MHYPEKRTPAVAETAGAHRRRSTDDQTDKREDSPNCSIGQGLHEFLEPPTHPDAQLLWPILLFAYDELLDTYSRLALLPFPRLANLFGRMAEAIRDQMIDAELGLLRASPEQRVAHAENRTDA